MVFRRSVAVHLHHEPVLGTILHLYLKGPRAELRGAEAATLAEIGRLEQIFSVYRTDSELNRWKLGGHEPGPELNALLVDARRWQVTSAGAFNPAVGAISARWKQAEADGYEPTTTELNELAAAISEPRYDERLALTADGSVLNFNAFAKGRVVDLTCRHVMAHHRLDSVMVNIGGDLQHAGSGVVEAAVENPSAAYDNAAPFAVIRLSNQAIATSGSSRRGFQVGDRWYSHVIDPRTGWPVESIMSSSVVAPDAATADAVATVIGVVEPAEGTRFAAKYPHCIVLADSTAVTNDAWRAVALARREPDQSERDQ